MILAVLESSLKIITDTSKLTNVRIARLRQCSDVSQNLVIPALLRFSPVQSIRLIDGLPLNSLPLDCH